MYQNPPNFTVMYPPGDEISLLLNVSFLFMCI